MILPQLTAQMETQLQQDLDRNLAETPDEPHLEFEQ